MSFASSPRAGLRVAGRLVAVLVAFGALAATATELNVSYQDALSTWWSSTSKLTLGETGYDAKGLRVRDGLCTWSFDEGVLLPVSSGVAPVSQRFVGFVFLGKGKLSVEFPKRSDAERFANHLVRRMGKDLSFAGPIARREVPYEVEIDRGMVLSADPVIEKLLYDREPVGSGAVLSDDPEIDGNIVVTASRNRLIGKVTAYDLIPERRLLYEQSGIDLTVALRQDRLLHEELGVPGEELRAFSDFRTADSFRVATTHGRGGGVGEADRWLSCVRDGSGMYDTGFRAFVFSHGDDEQQRRHLQNFSSDSFRGSATEPPRPPRSWEPIEAKSSVDVANIKGGYYRELAVSSTVTMRAMGGSLQHLALKLPSGAAVEDSFAVEALTLKDGTPLAWVWLDSERYSGPVRSTAAAVPAESTTADRGTSTSSDSAGGGRLPSTSITSPTTPTPLATTTAPTTGGDTSSATALMTESTRSAAATGDNTDEDNTEVLNKHTPVYREIIAILPRPVAAGDTFTFVLRWKARWLYANLTESGLSLGATTGPQPYLPELLPAFGGTLWSLHTTLTLPFTLLRPSSAALSGDTVRIQNDPEGGRYKVEARASQVRRPVLAIGEWSHLDDPAGTPRVQVHLFPNNQGALGELPPEIRRIAIWFDRLLPGLPATELDVFEDVRQFAASALTGALVEAPPGMLNIKGVATSGVVEAGRTEANSPHHVQFNLARQVGSQYWNQWVRPATGRDLWISDALSSMYAGFYLRSVHGVEEYAKWVDLLRKRVEDPASISEEQRVSADLDRPLSLTGSTRFTDQSARARSDYATFIMAETLRAQIGDTALYAGLDKLATERGGKTLSTEQLQRALEAASGVSLQDFFDMWVHGGYLPTVALYHQTDSAGKMSGCVTSDVPFGRFSVPIAVHDKGGMRQRELVLAVQNGVGRFEVEGLSGVSTAVLDPGRVVLALKRTESEGACPL